MTATKVNNDPTADPLYDDTKLSGLGTAAPLNAVVSGFDIGQHGVDACHNNLREQTK